MDERIDYEAIFTPQGILGEVSKNPNLDFLMNIFNIPRVYSVSGFGTWNVGQHTMATAFLTLYWSAFRSYPAEKRDRLVTLALIMMYTKQSSATFCLFSKQRQSSRPSTLFRTIS